MVSRLADGVKVGSGSKNLSYLCDDDLDNYYTLPSVADVNLIVGSPIVAVKDMKHYIDKDTKAGFKISGIETRCSENKLPNSFLQRWKDFVDI